MRYLRIFFTFLGYCTFISLIGAATFWYIGHKKAQKKVEPTVTYNVSMTPEKTISEFEPISRPATTKPQKTTKRPRTRKWITAAKAAKAQSSHAPVAYTVAAPKKETAKPAKAKPIKKTAIQLKKKTKQPEYQQPEMPPCMRVYRVTDNGTSPRTGRGIDVSETTELERAVIKRMQDRKELEAAARQIRNPPVWESGIMKLFSSN